MTLRSARTTVFARRARAVIVAAHLAVGIPVPALAGGVAMPVVPALPAVSEALIVHDTAGIAILGYDPVAYFAQGRAVGGLRQHELHHKGHVWRFASAANLAAFQSAPDIYMPAFGGHDAIAVSRGRAVDSEPRYFRISDGRLFLFRNAESRDLFVAQPEMALQADQRWDEVARQLAR